MDESEQENHANLLRAVNLYRERFGAEPEHAAFAPGRVNLIGEHTDYNDGFVLPFALPFRTIVVGSRCKGGSCTVVSASQAEEGTFEVGEGLRKGQPLWANYVKGTVFQYLKDLDKDFAFNAVFVSNVPLGSGLSSSASLEVATAVFLETLHGGMPQVSGVMRALRAQQAEHSFADTPCGIMDQYISSMGQRGSLLLIDCRTRGYTRVPFGPTTNTSNTGTTTNAGTSAEPCPVILVCNSCVKHSLSGSEYPDRVRQCRAAVTAIQKAALTGALKGAGAVSALRDCTLDMLGAVRGEVGDVVFRRARHCIGEDARTLAAVEALGKHDYMTVGEKMTESHNSLRDDFEVSCPELDVLVRIALTVPGVYGSRMTGGGFGGCTVTLVQADRVAALEQALSDDYYKQTGMRCVMHRALPSEGAGCLDLALALEGGKTGVHDPDTHPIPSFIPTLTPLSPDQGWGGVINMQALGWLVPASVLAVSVAVYLGSRRRQ